MAAQFTIVLASDLEPTAAWDRVADFRRYGEAIPLNVVDGAPPAHALRAGSTFTASTGLGPLAVPDPMVLDVVEPPVAGAPGRAVIRKRGRIARGTIELTVAARAGGGSTVTWDQRLSVLGVPALADPLLRMVAIRGYRAALRRVLATG